MSEQEDQSRSLEEMAFTRYFFVDRGGEADLTIEEARRDFENYYVAPLRLDTLETIVEQVVIEAMDLHLDMDRPPQAMTEGETDAVCRSIGAGFLHAFLDVQNNKRL